MCACVFVCVPDPDPADSHRPWGPHHPDHQTHSVQTSTVRRQQQFGNVWHLQQMQLHPICLKLGRERAGAQVENIESIHYLVGKQGGTSSKFSLK